MLNEKKLGTTFLNKAVPSFLGCISHISQRNKTEFKLCSCAATHARRKRSLCYRKKFLRAKAPRNLAIVYSHSIVAGGLEVLSYSTLILDTIEVIYLLVLASFSNTLHVIFQFAAFYQIGQACFFHETLSQLPYLYNPVDIFPRCSPTFHVFQEN